MKSKEIDEEKIELLSHISNKIITLRKCFGWSQSELGRNSGLTSQCINTIEKKKNLPSQLSLQKIADAFNLSISELNDYKNIQPKKNKLKYFFTQFRDISKLNKKDQEFIKYIIDRLKE